MVTPGGTVPIEERGGRQYPVGTVYYSKRDKAFYSAGYEDRGPLTPEALTGRLSWQYTEEGRLIYRDETGAFIPQRFSKVQYGVDYGSRFIRIEETAVIEDPTGQGPGWNAEWIERFTVHRPDGKIAVVEVTHGIGNEFDLEAQTKQYWRKMTEALDLDTYPLTSAERRAISEEIRQMILRRDMIHRMNLGPPSFV